MFHFEGSDSNLIYNLTKVRPLFTLSHRGSDNSPLMNFVFAYCAMISTNQIVYFKHSAVFLKVTKVITTTLSHIKVTIDWSI